MQYIFNSTDVDITFHVESAQPRDLVRAGCRADVRRCRDRGLEREPRQHCRRDSRSRRASRAQYRSRLTARRRRGRSCWRGAPRRRAAASTSRIWSARAYRSPCSGSASSRAAVGLPERAVFTATSFAVIVLWVLIAGDNIASLTGEGGSGLETFFVGGVLMVAARPSPSFTTPTCCSARYEPWACCSHALRPRYAPRSHIR